MHQVGLDRGPPHEQRYRDLGVGVPGRHLLGHLELGRGEACPADGGTLALGQLGAELLRFENVRAQKTV